jgi:UDP-N-acetylmuramoyl-tripeptide--D-alanyl-D-alanine ligase
MREWAPIVTHPTKSPAGELPAFDATSLTAAIGGRLIGEGGREGGRSIRGGAVDSRKVEPGNAFFALPGERTDGHEFLADASRRGAAALVVSRNVTEDDVARLAAAGSGTAVIAVADVLAALHAAAAAWRARFAPLVVGVTGSLAKTSTKEQIAEVLAERWVVLRNVANENNEIGLPLTLLRLLPEHEVAVLEMGMYVPGEIRILSELARPHIGVVTAVRGTHLERAGSIDAIEAGKRELVEALSHGGTAVLNADDERVSRMAAAAGPGVGVVRYGLAADADVTAQRIESRGELGMSFALRLPATHAAGATPAATAATAGTAASASTGATARTDIEVTIPALGRHSVHNALAAAAVGLAVGLDPRTIARGLERSFSLPHRSTLLDLGQWRVLDDTYNAAPDSMIAALELLASLPGRRVAVLGEMLELGESSAEAHREVGEHAGRHAELLIGIGPAASDYAAGAARAGLGRSAVLEVADRDEALRVLGERLRPGDVVLVKASRGAELDLLVDQLAALASEGARA